jgi:hypothetical protein
MKESAVFQTSADDLKQRVFELTQTMNRYSVPFFSPRYIGHMCMEMWASHLFFDVTWRMN